MKIYQSTKNEYIDLYTIEENKINMYVCGPTLYSDIHIGNARPIIFFDVVYKFLMSLGYDVNYVSNITDIDDKIIIKAKELKISENQLVEDNVKAYEKVLKDLSISKIKMPRATEYVEEIIQFIKELVDTKYAYEKNGSVYFSVNRIKNYGEISNRNLEDVKLNTRVQAQEEKEDVNDFALWKKTEEGIKWDSPWGEGRPGWHTECVVMIREIFGDKIDIHGGGIDLKFPHHENENAQNCACSGSLANFWIHNGFINIDNEKMSKSLGNTILVKDIIAEYGSDIIKLAILNTKYSQPINLTNDYFLQIENIFNKLNGRYVKINVRSGFVTNKYVIELQEIIKKDFNFANAITYLLEIIKLEEDVELVDGALLYFKDIIGLKFEIKEEDEIPEKIQLLIEKRDVAKQNKDFIESDNIRKEIEQKGFVIKDTRNGVECQKK